MNPNFWPSYDRILESVLRCGPIVQKYEAAEHMALTWLDPVGLVARLLLAVIALSTAIEVLEATASLREERLSVLGINAVGELDLILGLLMLVSGTLVLAGLWTRAAVIGVLLTWWPSFLVPEDGSDWIATLAVGGLAIHLPAGCRSIQYRLGLGDPARSALGLASAVHGRCTG